LLLGGTVTGIWALSVDGELSGVCEAGHCPVDRNDQVDQLGTLTTTTNVLLGAGALLTVAGVVLLLVEGGSGGPASQDRGKRPDLNVAVGPGYWGVSAGFGF
jgi:hypothetical protein